MRKKVLLCITKPAAGGAQKYLYDIASHLPTDRFDPVVVAGSPAATGKEGGQCPLFDRLRAINIRTIAVPHLGRDINPLHEIAALFRLTKIFIKEKPDIIHLNSSKMGAMGGLAAFIAKCITLNFKLRVVFTVHGWGFREDRHAISQAVIFFASWISAFFHDHTIVINSADYTDAYAFIRWNKISLIPLGISSLQLLPRVEARTFISEHADKPISPHAHLIGATAELTKNKGLPYLLEAVHNVIFSSEKPDIHCVIMGEGEQRPELLTRINALHLADHVSLIGFIPDASQYLSAFDLFALSSVKEGLPYALMEAMAAGLPVVASHVGGIPDLISHGENGFLAPAKDSATFAKHFSDLLSSNGKRRMFGLAAKDTIVSRHSLQSMLARTISLYDQLTQPYK